MDARRFDSLIRGLVAIDWPRRHVARTIVAGLLAALIGGDAHTSARKKKRKKKKKPKCMPNCAGRTCGDPDGCQGACTGCPSGERCINDQCVSDTCTPACTGNETCLNGSCVCANGTKKCAGDIFGLCHECCPGASGGLFSPDCNDNLNGEHCVDGNGDNVYRCGCLLTQSTCGDGKCVACCTHQRCRELTNDEFRICVGGACLCNESAGFFECPDGSFHEGRCRHTSDDADACGPNCDRCDPPRSICAGGKCCFPPGQSCAGCHTCCCSGELGCGPGFICA